MRRMKLLLAGIFLLSSAAGFCFDLLQLHALRLGGCFYWPILAGESATVFLAVVIKKFVSSLFLPANPRSRNIASSSHVVQYL